MSSGTKYVTQLDGERRYILLIPYIYAGANWSSKTPRGTWVIYQIGVKRGLATQRDCLLLPAYPPSPALALPTLHIRYIIYLVVQEVYTA